VMYILVSFFLVLGRVEFHLPAVAMSSGFVCLVSVSGQGELGIEMEMIFALSMARPRMAPAPTSLRLVV
jgi:hypothetical protein